jgi:hypothetical protein
MISAQHKPVRHAERNLHGVDIYLKLGPVEFCECAQACMIGQTEFQQPDDMTNARICFSKRPDQGSVKHATGYTFASVKGLIKAR